MASELFCRKLNKIYFVAKNIQHVEQDQIISITNCVSNIHKKSFKTKIHGSTTKLSQKQIKGNTKQKLCFVEIYSTKYKQ